MVENSYIQQCLDSKIKLFVWFARALFLWEFVHLTRTEFGQDILATIVQFVAMISIIIYILWNVTKYSQLCSPLQ